MNKLFLYIAATFFLACNAQTTAKTGKSEDTANATKKKDTPDCNVALQFINDYTQFSSEQTTTVNDQHWIENNSLLTDNFKSAYKSLLDSAQKENPGLGLDFDPIFDAQDFPDKGFELSNCDNELGYVTLKGKEWKDFNLVLRVVQQDNKWLVDGSGVLNIPQEKRATR